MDAPNRVAELAERLQTGDCILFAGSGLSAASGYPTWREFASVLVDRYGGEESGYQREAISVGQTDSVVYNFSRRLGPEQMLKIIEEQYGPMLPPNPAHALLREFRFRAAFTANWDRLLEETFPECPVLTPNSAEDMQSLLLKGVFFLLKLYGDRRDPRQLSFSQPHFESNLQENKRFQAFLQGVLLQQSMVFVGCSLDGVENFLRSVQFSPGSQRTPHYAVTGVGGASWRSKAMLLEDRFGVVSLPYNDLDGKSMIEVLEDVRRFFPSAPTHSASQPTAVTTVPSKLQKAVLENIGPFERLELDFHSEWNVFLGNNGVGKSTVLKALAVALCGVDAAPWADRLIRGDAHSASIELTTGNRTYLTKIQRTLGSASRVESLPARPMDAEGWLVLGFPPLRMGTWGTPSARQEGSKIPVSEDVLPLIRGEADPRLDRLKQWLIDLDYRVKALREVTAYQLPRKYLVEETQTGELSTLTALFARFFEIVGRVTGDVELRFLGIDARNKRVMVDTGDGPVPLELVSQGMASLISWVGVLLQRMFEVYGSEEGTGRHALVLMDEIDAHMHPAWQQILIPRLREIFPSVQFIATTHSPLIVAGRSREEIQVFERDPETKKVVVSRPRMDFRGLRADQILTSVAFGLETTRDEDTANKQAKYAELLNREPSPETERELRALRSDPAISGRVVAESVVQHDAMQVAADALVEKAGTLSGAEAKVLATEAQRELDKIRQEFGL